MKKIKQLVVFAGLLVVCSASQGGALTSIMFENPDLMNPTYNMLSGSSKSISNAMKKISARQLRKDRLVNVNFNWTPVSLPFPNAKGANANIMLSDQWTLGVDYLKSGMAIAFLSFEIGEVDESNYTIQARRYFGDSFNVKMGVGQRNTKVNLAADVFDVALSNFTFPLSELEAKFIRLGVGNQWKFGSRFTFNVDWITVNVPYSAEVVVSASQYAETAEAIKDVQDAEKYLKYYPSMASFQMEFGVAF